MTSTELLRLDRLFLRNFRSFAECNINLHPHLTVFVAENGGGKTAILDALRIALSPFVEVLSGKPPRINLELSDVRRIHDNSGPMYLARSSEVAVSGYIDGQLHHWLHTRQDDGSRQYKKTRDIKYLLQAAQHLRERAVEENEASLTLPIVAFHGTQRLWYDRPRSEEKNIHIRRRMGRMLGYSGCLSSSSSLKGVVGLYEGMMTEASDSLSDFLVIQLLAAVEAVMQVVLKPTGWCNLIWDWDNDWNLRQKRLFVEHPNQGRLPPSALSDGVRTMLALVMDLALRCARLNPHLSVDAALQTPGVVLIDEVDMHLHPGWQQDVLQSLQKAFPLVQFIVTTHSPQVITTVPTECIRIIRENLIYAATPGTDGAESQRVLEDVFGVRPRPETEMSLNLYEYLRLVDARQWESPHALELRRKLDQWSQGYEPRLIEADIQIDNMKWEDG